MVKFERAHNMDGAKSLDPAVYKTATNGQNYVDLKGFESATVFVVCGAKTDGTHAIEVKDSPDHTTFTAVDAAYLIGSEPTDCAAQTIYRIGYIGNQRYLRVDLSASSGSTGIALGAFVVRGDAWKKPVTQA